MWGAGESAVPFQHLIVQYLARFQRLSSGTSLMQALNIVFAGTPPFAAKHLASLLDTRHRIVGVYTQPDRAAGRGKLLQPSAVKALALAHDLPVFQPLSLKGAEEQEQLAQLQPDVMVVVAYGLLLPQPVLDIPRYGCINVHGSLLPRWRGAAPIERALLAGDAETGITIMQMDRGLDTGAMLHTVRLPIGEQDDRQQLEDRLADIGTQGLVHALAHLQELRANAQPQDDSLSTYAHKLDKAEALIDWQQSAEVINRQIRCGIGRTPAYTFLGNERVRLLRATPQAGTTKAAPGTILEASRDGLRIACLDSTLVVTELQMPGKNALPVADVLNSRKALFAPGAIFSSRTADAT